MANDTGIRAVEQNILHILVLEIGSLQDVLQIRLGEAYSISHVS